MNSGTNQEGGGTQKGKATAYIKTKEGKYFKCRRHEGEVKLFACDTQRGGTLCEIMTRVEKQRNQMALQFRYNNISYGLKVEGNNIKLENVSTAAFPEDSDWFEKDNPGSGEHYGLKAMVETQQYLSIQRTIICRKGNPLTLSMEPLLITDEKVQHNKEK